MEGNITINGILLGQDNNIQNSIPYFSLLISAETGWKKINPSSYAYEINQSQHNCGSDIIIQFWELVNGYYRISSGFPQDVGIQIAYEATTGNITIISNKCLNGKIIIVGNKIKI